MHAIVSIRVPIRYDVDRQMVFDLVAPVIEHCRGPAQARLYGADLVLCVNEEVADDFGRTFRAACIALQAYARDGYHAEFRRPEQADDDAGFYSYYGPTPEHKAAHVIDHRIELPIATLGLTGKTVVAAELGIHMREAMDYRSVADVELPPLPAGYPTSAASYDALTAVRVEDAFHALGHEEDEGETTAPGASV